jgi:hypothetical protein
MQQSQPQHQQKSDPFASLATPPRQASPFQFQQSTSKSPVPSSQANQPPPPQRTSTIDLLGMGSNNDTSASRPSTSHDDEWTFSSALPDQPSDLTVTDSSIKTVFTVSRSSDSELLIQSRISNSTHQPIGDLTFQLAVTKVHTHFPAELA